MRALVLALALVSGCGGSLYFRPHAFVPPLRHYRIRYDDAETRRVLPAAWRVLNLRNGRIDARSEYVDQIWVDEGRGPRQLVVPLFDVYAEHERDGSAIFAMTLPMPLEHDRRELQILARDFASGAFGGAGLSLVRTRRGGTTEEHLEVTRTLEDSPARVGGAEGHYLSVERGAVGSGSSVILTFVLVRPHRWRWHHGGLTSTSGGAPMVLLFGYLATSERYLDHLDEFEGLLHRIDVRPDPG